MNFKDDLIECKCLFCNKNFQQKCDEKLKERVLNTCEFSNHDSNNFILLFRKGVYLYEYAYDCEKFNETSLPEKEDFYSHLNMGDITDADYTHAKRVCKDFWNKTFRRISWFVYSKRYVIVSRCIWEPSKYVSWNIWAWSCKITFSCWISMPCSFKKTKVKLDLSTRIDDTDMLLMVENGIRRWI